MECRRSDGCFPQKARQIDEALDLATTYAWNSFRNLQLLKTSDDTDTPVHQLIKRFHRCAASAARACARSWKKSWATCFTALLDPTLRKTKSSRFVVGRVVEGADNTFAFIVPTDAKQKIYLAERFFDPGFDIYRQHLTDTTSRSTPMPGR